MLCCDLPYDLNMRFLLYKFASFFLGSILFSGSNPKKSLHMLSSIGVVTPQLRQFFVIQKAALFPAVRYVSFFSFIGSLPPYWQPVLWSLTFGGNVNRNVFEQVDAYQFPLVPWDACWKGDTAKFLKCSAVQGLWLQVKSMLLYRCSYLFRCMDKSSVCCIA